MNEKGGKCHEALSVRGPKNPTYYTVCCSGFKNDITEDLIRKTFSQYGTIVDIRIFEFSGFAFIKFTTKEAAIRAIEATNNTKINGSIVQSYWENANPPSVGLDANNKNQETEEGFITKDRLIKAACVGAGVVGAIYLAPVAVAAIGFQAGGIAAGSTAASMMSALGGGATASGGIVATCQSIGATGTILGSTGVTAGVSTVGGVVGSAASNLFTSSEKKNKQAK